MRILLTAVLAGCNTLPAQRERTVEDVFADVYTSVVTIRTAERSVAPEKRIGLTSIAGLGSGVLISDDGKILTAAHVVQTADAIAVQFVGGELRRARVIASDPLADVALLELLQAAPFGTRPATLGDSDLVRTGRRVFVVGAPLGISHTLSVGHISARRPASGELRSLHDVEHFQTDAAINQGNSGGPMFDLDGNVVGIVSYMVSPSGGSDGLGFAVTANVARTILLERGAFWTGVDGLFISGYVARVLNTPGGKPGFLVQQVARNSPAARLGIRGGTIAATIGDLDLVLGGDIVLEVLGIAVSEDSRHRITELLPTLEPGREIRATVLRRGELLELKMTVPG